MSKKPEIGAANPFEAFRNVVYLHDVPTLASDMGMRPGTLYNKADADHDSHNQPTLRDVVMVTRLSGDMRILDALNEMFNRAAFDVAPYACASDAALLELITKMGVESGEFHAAVRQALLAKKFTAPDLQRIREEAFDLVGALMTLVARVEGLLDE
ncbi:phage regulatory CII family protein [Hydrogenophaga sp.]|uniref:phage regulatory CII family protein n=1 Tax=Hydrogenophaga sp. TaxID=1904254 RepID=UPI003D0A3570